MSRQLKIKPSRKSALAAPLLCVVVVIAIFITHHVVSKAVDCKKILASAAQLTKQNQPKQAYAKLNTTAGKCTSVASLLKQNSNQSVKAKAQAVSYGITLATAAFNSDNKEQAYKTADQVQAVLKTMSAQEKAQVPNGNNLAMQLITIQTIRGNTQPSP
jgi:hypothetical protein